MPRPRFKAEGADIVPVLAEDGVEDRFSRVALVKVGKKVRLVQLADLQPRVAAVVDVDARATVGQLLRARAGQGEGRDEQTAEHRLLRRELAAAPQTGGPRCVSTG